MKRSGIKDFSINYVTCKTIFDIYGYPPSDVVLSWSLTDCYDSGVSKMTLFTEPPFTKTINTTQWNDHNLRSHCWVQSQSTLLLHEPEVTWKSAPYLELWEFQTVSLINLSVTCCDVRCILWFFLLTFSPLCLTLNTANILTTLNERLRVEV